VRKRIKLQNLTVQVLLAILLGIAVGYAFPDVGARLKVLADVFIKMIKMIIPPVVFFTVVLGIANMGDMKKLGRVGGKALLYFEIVTTFALIIGMIVVNVIQPGAGVDRTAVQEGDISQYTQQAQEVNQGFVDFVVSIIPDNVVAAMAKGDLLPILFFAVLFGIALARLGERAKPVTQLFERLNEAFFGVVNIVMRFSPIGAFGAMAYTIGKFGIDSLQSLGKLMACVYLTMFFFILLVLGAIARMYGFRILSFIRYIKDEILLVLGTSSSESALPRLMEKLERYGCSRSVVGLVLPTGYSFNLDGYLHLSVHGRPVYRPGLRH
jgi:Na+/H+-dicarboxylate symporters